MRSATATAARAAAPWLMRTGGRLPGVRLTVDLVERRRRQAMLIHHLGRRRPPIAAAIVPEIEPQARDVEIADRLLRAHRAATRDGPASPDPARPDLWQGIYRRQQRFAAILGRADPEELAGYLCNVSRHDASQGITQGDIEYRRVRHDRSYRAVVALMTKDILVALAEAVGARAIENPAQGPLGQSLHADPDLLVEEIEARIGTDLRPPDVDGGLFKLCTSRGLFGERDLNAIFTAYLIRRALAGQPGARICEIGAGSGRAAYWSHRLGARSITLIDLPHVNVVQGYYLLRCLPDAPITLYGEPLPAGGDGVRVLPSHALAAADHGGAFDLVLNQDSFTEMHADTVDDYLDWIRASCRGRLISINHESKPRYGMGHAHVNVAEAVARGGGLELEDRCPYWLRKGYVTEVYRVI